MDDENCTHPDPVFLHPATDEEGFDVLIYRCTECGSKWAEGV